MNSTGATEARRLLLGGPIDLELLCAITTIDKKLREGVEVFDLMTTPRVTARLREITGADIFISDEIEDDSTRPPNESCVVIATSEQLAEEWEKER